MKHYDPEQYHENLTCEEAHAQIVYLREVKKYGYELIAHITHYAVSTVKTYCRKFRDLLEKAKQIFGMVKNKVRERFHKVYNDRVHFEVLYKSQPCAYVIELKNSSNKTVFLKVGKANDALERFTGILKTAKYAKEYDITHIVVKELYYCQNEDDALTIENELRKSYKQEYPDAYVRNDRFKQAKPLDDYIFTFTKFCDLLSVEKAPCAA